MKTKTEVAKILLKAGWSLDEVEEVLDCEITVTNRVDDPAGYGTYGRTISKYLNIEIG